MSNDICKSFPPMEERSNIEIFWKKVCNFPSFPVRPGHAGMPSCPPPGCPLRYRFNCAQLAWADVTAAALPQWYNISARPGRLKEKKCLSKTFLQWFALVFVVRRRIGTSSANMGQSAAVGGSVVVRELFDRCFLLQESPRSFPLTQTKVRSSSPSSVIE